MSVSQHEQQLTSTRRSPTLRESSKTRIQNVFKLRSRPRETQSTSYIDDTQNRVLNASTPLDSRTITERCNSPCGVNSISTQGSVSGMKSTQSTQRESPTSRLSSYRVKRVNSKKNMSNSRTALQTSTAELGIVEESNKLSKTVTTDILKYQKKESRKKVDREKSIKGEIPPDKNRKSNRKPAKQIASANKNDPLILGQSDQTSQQLFNNNIISMRQSPLASSRNEIGALYPNNRQINCINTSSEISKMKSSLGVSLTDAQSSRPPPVAQSPLATIPHRGAASTFDHSALSACERSSALKSRPQIGYLRGEPPSGLTLSHQFDQSPRGGSRFASQRRLEYAPSRFGPATYTRQTLNPTFNQNDAQQQTRLTTRCSPLSPLASGSSVISGSAHLWYCDLSSDTNSEDEKMLQEWHRGFIIRRSELPKYSTAI